MPEMSHFTYGFSTPVLAYLASCVGAAVGLTATSRARASSTRTSRSLWLLVGAVAIGGTGVWLMHFIAMLGFTVSGMPIHYDIPMTIYSALVAVAVVAIGLFLVGFAGDRAWALLVGGLVAGFGVATMHYMGMASMEMAGHTTYTTWLVVASVVIAVVAATAALWLSVHVKGWKATTGAAMLMGLAVSGMHYTGMAAMNVEGSPGLPPGGANPSDMHGPLIFGIAALVVAVTFIAMMPTETEIRARDDFETRQQARRSRVTV